MRGTAHVLHRKADTTLRVPQLRATPARCCKDEWQLDWARARFHQGEALAIVPTDPGKANLATYATSLVEATGGGQAEIDHGDSNRAY